MHSIALELYKSTEGSDFRNRTINRTIDNFFPFDAVAYDAMAKESCIVSMVMAWSVVALESVVNLGLAENIQFKRDAVKAIEYPKKVLKKTKYKSDLAVKLIILSDSTISISEVFDLAEEVSDIRNVIVHDKPFDMVNDDSGDVEVDYFKCRGKEPKIYRYENLHPFFCSCDQIYRYILTSSKEELYAASGLNFASLIV